MAEKEKNVVNFSDPLSVLIVEDNEVDYKMLSSMLKDESYKISYSQVTETLADAVKALKEKSFDVAIVDLNLSDSKGELTLKEITEQFPLLPVVVNTGAYEDDLGLKTLGYGAQDFLVKSKYTAYTLIKALRYAIERKRLELELKDTMEQLSVTQRQLIEAERMRIIGGLASGVAHEVKNPLATILYGVTYLTDHVQVDDEKYQVVLDNIRAATHKANNIIVDLLDFASLSRLNKKATSLEDIIEKSLSLVGHEIDKHKVSVSKEITKDLQDIVVDKNRIEQVVVNLLLNAIYSITEGGNVHIRVHNGCLSSEMIKSMGLSEHYFKNGDRYLFMHIEDNGSGIKNENLDKLCDPFFTTRRAKGGIGLGLPVSKNIMELHEGSLCVQNKEDEGARATLIFRTSL